MDRVPYGLECAQVRLLAHVGVHKRRFCFPQCTTETFGVQKSALLGCKWVQVSRDEPGRKAKKPCTSCSQQPACTHKEHPILTSAEATAFAAQFLDRKVYLTQASQQEFLATCIDVDLEKNVKHAQWHKYTRKRGHKTTYFIPYRGACREICKIQFVHYFKISRIAVESVAKVKAAAATAAPLNLMKGSRKQATVNTRRALAIKIKFEKFL